MSKQKRLQRSSDDKVILGVCGGFANYFSVDPVLTRVVGVAILIFSGLLPAVIAYLVFAIIMPLDSDVKEKSNGKKD